MVASLLSACVVSLAAAVFAEPPAAAPADESAAKELAQLVRQLGDAASYQYEYAAATERSGGKGKRGGAGGSGDAAAPDDPPAEEGSEGGAAGDAASRRARDAAPWTVRVQRGRPLHVRRGDAEFFRGENKIALLDGKSGKWIGMDRGAQAATGRGAIVRQLAEVERIVVPTALLAGLEGKLGEVVKRDADGMATYVATLPGEIARALVAEDERGGAARGPEASGKLEIAAKDGAVAAISLEVTFAGAATRTVRRSFKLSAIGTTTVEVPEPARKALGGE